MLKNATGIETSDFDRGGVIVVALAARPRAEANLSRHQSASGADRRSPSICARPIRTVQSGDVGLQPRVDERSHQADQPAVSVCRRETHPDRNREFWR